MGSVERDIITYVLYSEFPYSNPKKYNREKRFSSSKINFFPKVIYRKFMHEPGISTRKPKIGLGREPDLRF